MKKFRFFYVWLLLACLPSLVCGEIGFIEDAVFYLSFEGENLGIDSDCWKNNGTVGYDESPYRVGDSPAFPEPNVVSLIDNVKGNAYDGTMFTNQVLANAFEWGIGATGGGADSDTDVEYGLKDPCSLTITGWIKTPGDYANARILRVVNVIELNHDFPNLGIKLEQDDWLVTDSNTFDSNDQWVFFAVVYDGAADVGQTNLWVYSGGHGDANTVSLAKSFSVSNGQLVDTSYGALTALGNTGYLGSRPFVGWIDELRVWTSRDPGLPATLTESQLENVRLWDLGLYTAVDCEDVAVFGDISSYDLNANCYVDVFDLSQMAHSWLSCNQPGDDNCPQIW